MSESGKLSPPGAILAELHVGDLLLGGDDGVGVLKTPGRQEFEGPGLVKHREGQVWYEFGPIEASATMAEAPWVTWENSGRRFMLEHEYGELSLQGAKGVWQLQGCVVDHPERTAEIGRPVMARFRGRAKTLQFQARAPDAATAWVAWGFSDFEIDHWPSAVERRDESGGWLSRCCWHGELFGAPAVLVQRDAGGVWLVVPARHVESFDADALDAVRLTLCFLGGRPTPRVAKREYGSDGTLLRGAERSTGMWHPHRVQQPLPAIAPGGGFRFPLWSALPGLVRNVYQAPKELMLREAIAHLNSAQVVYAETRCILLCVALETLAGGARRVSERKATEPQRIVDKGIWTRASKSALRTVREQLGDATTREELHLLRSRLGQVNQRPSRTKLEALFAAAQICPRRVELAAWEARNRAVHDGVLTMDRDEVNLEMVIDIEDCLLVLLQRAILGLLGYHGPVIDYAERGRRTLFDSARIVRGQRE